MGVEETWPEMVVFACVVVLETGAFETWVDADYEEGDGWGEEIGGGLEGG